MKKSLILIIGIVLLSLGEARAQESLQTRSSLVAALETLIADYKKSPEASQKPGAPKTVAASFDELMPAQDRTELETLASVLDTSLDDHAKRGFSLVELEARVAALDNGPRWSDRMKAQLGVTSSRVRGADGATYAEMIAWLVARYYDQPADRDAIYALLKRVARDVRPEVRSRNRDAEVLAENVMAGTTTAMTLLFLWETRDGFLKFGQTLTKLSASAVRRTLSRFAAEEAPAGTDLARSWLWGSRGATQATEQEAGMVTQAARERAQGEAGKVAEELGALASGSAKAAREVPEMAPHKSLAEQFRSLARQTAVSLVVGGLPYGLSTLNEQSEAAKVDPLAVLKIFQTFSFIEIETAGAALAAQVRGEAEELKKKKKTPDLVKKAKARFDEHFKQYSKMRSELVHLDDHAKEFKGVVAYSNTAARLRSYRAWAGRLKLLRSPEEQMTAFLAGSAELERKILSIDETIRKEAKAHGFGPDEALAASLEASAVQLQALELALRAFYEALGLVK